jgi:hypothetical protein
MPASRGKVKPSAMAYALVNPRGNYRRVLFGRLLARAERRPDERVVPVEIRVIPTPKPKRKRP